MQRFHFHVGLCTWLLLAVWPGLWAQPAEGFRPMPLASTRLLPSPWQTAQQANAAWLRTLDPDRLLHRYRLFAGLPPLAPLYGGWESRGISGHSLGHYLSACAQAYAATGGTFFHARVAYIVAQLSLCQQANGNGYAGAIPDQDSLWAQIARGDIRSQGFDLNGAWVPWYTLHKVWAGLIDAVRYANYSPALEVAIQLSDWAINSFDHLPDTSFQRMLACEHGGMNEAFADMYALTGEKRYLAFARRFSHRAILAPLAQASDELAGKHANTQIPKVIGAARLFELDKDPADSMAAAFFLETVVQNHTYANGGNSEYEHFGPPRQLSNRLSEATSETCNTYNLLKLTRMRQQVSLQSIWGDYIERALINHILASQNPANGMVSYFMPLQAGGKKAFSTPDSSFWCCVGTGWENHARYGEYIYYHNNRGLVIDQFIPSVLSGAGWERTLSCRFPESDTIFIRIKQAPKKHVLLLRKPGWAQSWAVLLNGKPTVAKRLPVGYLQISNGIRPGAEVAFVLQRTLRSESILDMAPRRALFFGPILLAGVLDSATFPDALTYPVITASPAHLSTWLTPLDSRGAFVSSGAGRPADLAFRPLFQVVDDPYIVYLDFFDEQQWEARKTEREAQKARQENIRRRTVDELRIGEMQPERDHLLRGENTESGEAFGRKWRHAADGFFQFELKADPEAPCSLVVTYWGGDTGNRTFDIYINGQWLARQTLDRNRPDEFFDQSYSIPSAWTQGKSAISVRFESLPGNIAGGVYGCALLRDTE